MILKLFGMGIIVAMMLLEIIRIDLSSVLGVGRWATLLMFALALWCALGVIRKDMWRESV
jgi:hypothetical protein